jgi:preprotein translocase subunit SecB
VNKLVVALRRPHGPLPAAEILDATHIASAAISGCHLLLTWNQKHLANPFTRGLVDNIVRRHGYQTPLILTPGQFLQAASE